MEDKRKCPIMKALPCLREDCHWWLQDWNSCSIKVIARMLECLGNITDRRIQERF